MDAVAEIKSRLTLEDYVSESVKLRRSGRSLSGFCPFHANSRTPAFYVFPDTQTWHCFGACSTGGDIFTFVMKKENVDFPEALKLLAARAGVALTRDGGTQDHSRETLLKVLEAASERFHYLLKHSPAAQFARDYIARRRLSTESIDRFQLGFAPNEFEATRDALTTKGFSPQDLEAAGIITPNSSGKGYHDRFRNRLMFPIRDRAGHVIAFGARALDAHDQPKYLNSPETPLFSKSATLYGLDLAKDAIHAQDLAVIVEGYMDVIATHQAGFKNVVASLGTALTEKHIALLKRLTKNYALALDPDAAGKEATRRGIVTALQAASRKITAVPLAKNRLEYQETADIEVYIVRLPPEQDPDEVALRDPEDWAARVAQRVPWIEYDLDTATEGLDLTRANDKARAREIIVGRIAQIGNRAKREHYAQLWSRRLGMDSRAFSEEVEGKMVRVKPDHVQAATPLHINRERYFLALALTRPDLLKAVQFLEPGDFSGPEWSALFDWVQTQAEPRTADRWLAEVDEALRPCCIQAFEEAQRWQVRWGIKSDAEMELDLEVAAWRLRLQRCQDEVLQLSLLQEETTDPEERMHLMERANALRVEMAQCKKQLQERNVLSRPSGLSRGGAAY